MQFGTTQTMKLITAVLYRTGALEVVRALHNRGINRAAMWHARGSAIGDPTDRRGRVVSFEKEMVVVAVAADQADEIFEFIFETAQIDRPHGGFLYMETLRGCSEYLLGEAPEESGDAG